MAILYVRTVNDPSNAGPFPPSILESDWYLNISTYTVNNGFVNNQGHNVFYFFASETELNSFLDTWRCTDTSVLTAMKEWNAAHGITIKHDYFELTPSSGVNPIGLTGNLSGEDIPAPPAP